jgi:non-homologous end joining protein Ku
MKKIVKLTESDLSRIVKRVIKEEDEMEGMGMSITVRDIFDEVRNALHDLGMYDDASMGKKAMALAKQIMSNMRDDLAYVTENYEEQLEEILGDEDYDDEDEY